MQGAVLYWESPYSDVRLPEIKRVLRNDGVVLAIMIIAYFGVYRGPELKKLPCKDLCLKLHRLHGLTRTRLGSTLLLWPDTWNRKPLTSDLNIRETQKGSPL